MNAEEIENLILNEHDFEEQLKIYTTYYSILENGERIYSKGPKDVKLFCKCRTCQKELPDFDAKFEIFNKYLMVELQPILDKLSSLTDYKEKLVYYDKHFDVNGSRIFPELNISLSIKPQHEHENKVFNLFQYDRFLENYFLVEHSSMKKYYQMDFKARLKVFNHKKLHATYPELSAVKEIELLNKHFEGHWNSKTTALYFKLIDGFTIDYSQAEWPFEECLEIVEANEGVKFLRYLENVKRIDTSFSKTFHQVIQQSHEAYESYSVVTWKLINGCIQEIKDKLYELNNDDSRIAYLKTTLLSFKINGFEDYFKEVEDDLGDDIRVNSGLESVGNVVRIIDSQKSTLLYEGIAGIIKGRNTIVLEISEHVVGVYPTINFTDIMNAVDYRTKSTFWIGSSKFSGSPKQFLKAFPDAEKSYNSGMEKIQKGIYQRNALDDLRLSLELLLKQILGNSKSLENQRPAITEFFKNNNVSLQIANMFWTLIDQYSKYHNDSVKHNDNIQHSEVDLVFNLTTIFIKQIIQYA
ncbi:MAG: hypothetical protein JWQ85_2572 [Mucilaginibacter sp.]|nr:hypothetical protein [Mucilaginibacter sp.]